MEKVVVGISLNTLFKPKLEKLEVLTNQTDAIFLHHQGQGVYDKGPLFDFIQQLLNCKKHNLLSFIELILISDVSPEISPFIIESLTYYKLEIDQIILSHHTKMADYLKALNVDLYLSADLGLVREVQKLNIMTGLICLKNLRGNVCRFGIDHRLFSDEQMVDAVGKMIPVFGLFQKLLKDIKVSLLTTRSYSVESWVKDLFRLSQCKINEVCFLGVGSIEDISPLFDFSIYIEGCEHEPAIGAPPPDYILNIDFKY